MNGKKIEKQRAKGKEESEMKRKGLKQKAREENIDRGRQKARMRQRTSRRGGQSKDNLGYQGGGGGSKLPKKR